MRFHLFAFQILTNYQDRDDFVAPVAIGYGPSGAFSQSFADTLTLDASVAQTGTTEPAPEPTTWVLLGLGLAGVAAYGRRRRAA